MYKSTEVYEMNSPCNAKDELLKVLATPSGLIPDFFRIKCADITIKASNKRALEQFGVYEDPNPVVAELRLNYSGKELATFLDKIDVVYDSGFGGQELFGTVWLHDGTWLTREEHDGSEGWLHHKSPEISEDLL